MISAEWEQATGLTEARMNELLRRDLPAGTDFALGHDAQADRFDLSGPGFRDWRSFDLKRGRADAGVLSVDAQERGIGRLVIRNEIEFFRACGARRFNIAAGNSAGGYSWARFGFLPDDVRNPLFQEYTQAPARARLAAVAPLLDAADMAALEDALEFREGRDMWRLADNRLDLGPCLTQAFADAARGNDAGLRVWRKIAASYPVSRMESGSDRMMETLQHRLRRGQPVPAGRLLLAATKWSGHIDFANAEQMERAGKYAGGWQTPGI